jgi:hypothetical protein
MKVICQTLEGGTEFDAAPRFDFTLGAGDVIKGWDKAGFVPGREVYYVQPGTRVL